MAGKLLLPSQTAPPFEVTFQFYTATGVGRTFIHPPSTADFRFPLPSGSYKIVIIPADKRCAGPGLDPIAVSPGGTYDMRAVLLIPRDAQIVGLVSDDSSLYVYSGDPVEITVQSE